MNKGFWKNNYFKEILRTVEFVWKIVIDFLYNICKEREEKPKVKEKVNFEREREREKMV